MSRKYDHYLINPADRECSPCRSDCSGCAQEERDRKLAAAPAPLCPTCGSPDPAKCYGMCPDKWHPGEVSNCYITTDPNERREIPAPAMSAREFIAAKSVPEQALGGAMRGGGK